ncbi:SOCS protein, C-terminal domain and B30.2/SPRY domain and SPla/RYanodine receptor SPRY domain and Concanavalin A-like lectin/glucanases superfamily domain and SPla/RYanodine receptor subgroup domain-containing protein [Strongyloides ratti]|uniref:B30.2/SPRY domain-containing protein n=1 Tax=Strongyloides ratti TaxID=34506 RepID=A0A090MRH3_STRRB|nr:SOCS protein, C-terminal domain and B30.2/SPRY domain and SPla/RYanodine receptor SPRY domain and Concanavalin A-like lectin/glucanases superfamily domain and SPla/RYanodine receptor subgroup domain-containing protein [Strongyloides ratti]CEF60818.1 SOCS protein, C-terminal domain and B30.2/SPRY domain and SPla/RYanodine receptor SPRY domain and Concanavalin A-like lectin/glucanases superfamily domain and SPla/RYanodine receptor subgroup domain-containing protein [Strongyloides ratti]
MSAIKFNKRLFNKNKRFAAASRLTNVFSNSHLTYVVNSRSSNINDDDERQQLIVRSPPSEISRREFAHVHNFHGSRVKVRSKSSTLRNRTSSNNYNNQHGNGIFNVNQSQQRNPNREPRNLLGNQQYRYIRMMGQRASMEDQEGQRMDNDQDGRLEEVADRFLNGYLENRPMSHHRFAQVRESFLELTSRHNTSHRGPIIRSRTKAKRDNRTRSPSFLNESEEFYHADECCPKKFEIIMDSEPVEQKVMEEHAWNPNDRSLNIFVKEDDPLTLHRHPVAQSTDCIRGKVGYSHGFHVWKITWPRRQRGTHAVIGVATKEARLHAVGYTSLIGSTSDSYGWDIVRLKCSHDARHKEQWDYPNNEYIPNGLFGDTQEVPESIYCILDMDEGYMAFATDDNYLGVAFRGLRGKTLYPIVSAVWGHCEITIGYMGGFPPEAPSLMSTCRRVIRSHLGRRNIKNIYDLNLSKCCIDYLLYK